MTTYPYVRVDFAHRILSVVLNDRQIVATRQFDDAHLVDVDAEGRVVAIEILSPENLRIEDMAEQFGFVDQATVIRNQIRKVLAPPTGTTASYGEPIVIHATASSGTSLVESEARSEAPIWKIS
jgi:uncharacterized protein YuzE